MAQPILKWKAYEHPPRERGTDWYWAVISIGITLGVIAVILNNVLFAVFILIATGALVIQTLKKPRIATYALHHKGVRIKDVIYPYNEFESFWIEENPHETKLILKPANTFSLFRVIPVADDVDVEHIRDILLDHMDEAVHPEPLSYKLMEYLGF